MGRQVECWDQSVIDVPRVDNGNADVPGSSEHDMSLVTPLLPFPWPGQVNR